VTKQANLPSAFTCNTAALFPFQGVFFLLVCTCKLHSYLEMSEPHFTHFLYDELQKGFCQFSPSTSECSTTGGESEKACLIHTGNSTNPTGYL